LIDAGHFATEQLMIEQVTQSLQAAARQLNWGVAFEAYTGEEDPFRFY
jgi:putative NIF3 family GTP cyclohydrolase 1 type 2